MAPSPSTELELETTEFEVLLDLADAAIAAGLDGRHHTPPAVSTLTAGLASVRGAFVTLHVRHELNGCIGSIEGAGPLAIEVGRLARAAAFDDPRLPPLRRADLAHLEVEVSVLSPLMPAPAASRSQLAEHVRPGVDGLLLGDSRRRAVFLPAVWAQIPDPDDFIDHLLHKAALSPRGWAPDMRAHVFTSTSAARPSPLAHGAHRA